MNDIVAVSSEIIDVIKKHELSKVHAKLALKAVEMSIDEEMIKEIMDEHNDNKTSFPGVN
jgi:hypothetical protein